MRQPRHLLFLAAAALAGAAPALAQKPGADEIDPERERYRGQGISICVADLRGVEDITPDEQEAVCGCALERLMEGRALADLPRIRPRRLDPLLAGPLVSCAAQQRPGLAPAVGRYVMERQAARPAIEPPIVAPLEPDKPVPVPAPADQGSDFDLSAWFEGLRLPAWLTASSGGLPGWAWMLLAALGLLVARFLFRGRDGAGDLTGPPSHMLPRSGPRPPPPIR